MRRKQGDEENTIRDGGSTALYAAYTLSHRQQTVIPELFPSTMYAFPPKIFLIWQASSSKTLT